MEKRELQEDAYIMVPFIRFENMHNSTPYCFWIHTYICSKSIKTCMTIINTIFRVRLTSEEGGNGLMQRNTTVFRMSYVLKCFFQKRTEENIAKICVDI